MAALRAAALGAAVVFFCLHFIAVDASSRGRIMEAPEAAVAADLLSQIADLAPHMSPKQLQILKKTMISGKQTLRRNRRNVFEEFNPVLWLPPTENQAATTLDDVSFDVIVYHIPPFVDIDEPQGLQDPGNVNQTRTPDNGGITGFAIDMLEEIAQQLEVRFKYYYPCQVTSYLQNAKTCLFVTSTEALLMLDDVAGSTYFGTGPGFCQADRCFVAGAPKISEQTVRKYDVTMPFMEKGFGLAVRAGQPNPVFMSWANPFQWQLWMLVVAEIVVCAICFMIVEGYGTNEALWSFSGFGLAQFYDSMYWAITIMLGAADKAPTTNAGRTLVTTQLAFGVLLISLYTGNLSTFLSVTTAATKVQQFDDLYDPTSLYYSSGHTVCVPTEQASVAQYLDTVEQLEGVRFNRVEAPTVQDCLMQIYLDEVTATMYDESVLLFRINQMNQRGLCGDEGGYCTDPSRTDQEGCTCPEKTDDLKCLNPANNKWTSIQGSVTTVGQMFNHFGYGLVFRRVMPGEPSYYTAFSHAIQFLKEQGTLEDLEQGYIPAIEDIQCASSDSGGFQVLSFVNIQGLVTIVAFILFIGLCIGMMENIIAGILYVMPCCVSLCKCMEKTEDEAAKEAEEAAQEAHEMAERQMNLTEQRKHDRVIAMHDKISSIQERLSTVEQLLAESRDPEEQLEEEEEAQEMLENGGPQAYGNENGNGNGIVHTITHMFDANGNSKTVNNQV